MNGRARRVAVCGGIGSGKSVVCRVLRAMGFKVFDTDAEARRIMDTDPEIHGRLKAEIHPAAVAEGCVNRPLISEIVFADPQRLKALNEIVHGAVRSELEAWFGLQSKDAAVCFVETALLYQSGLDRMVDEVWEVEAPEELRVQRVMARNGLSEQQVRARIAAQSVRPEREHLCVRRLVNDGVHPLVPQIEAYLADVLNY